MFYFVAPFPELLILSAILLVTGETLLLGFSISNPTLPILLAYVVIYVLPIVAAGEEHTYSTEVVEVIELAFQALVIGFSVGYLKWLSSNSQILRLGVTHTVFNEFEINKRAIYGVGLPTIFLIVVILMAHPSFFQEGRGVSQYENDSSLQLALLLSDFTPAISTLAFLYFVAQAKFQKITLFSSRLIVGNKLLFFIAVFPIVYDLLTAGRHHALMTIVGWAIAYSLYFRRISIWVISVLSFGIGFFSLIMLVMRDLPSIGLSAAVEAMETFGDVLAKTDKNILLTIFNIGHMVQTTQEIIEYTAVNGYQYGQSYLLTLINILPTHFMYGEDFPVGVFYINQFHPELMESGGGWDFAGVAEMYLQGGRIGVFIAAYLLGYVVTLLYRRCLFKKSLWPFFLYLGFLFGMIWWFRSDALNFLRHIELYMAVLAAYFFFKKFKFSIAH